MEGLGFKFDGYVTHQGSETFKLRNGLVGPNPMYRVGLPMNDERTMHDEA